MKSRLCTRNLGRGHVGQMYHYPGLAVALEVVSQVLMQVLVDCSGVLFLNVCLLAAKVLVAPLAAAAVVVVAAHVLVAFAALAELLTCLAKHYPLCS